MISVKIVMVMVLTLCLLSNMKTVSTAVEELRDTVNEKIGEEKTAREEVVWISDDVDDGVDVNMDNSKAKIEVVKMPIRYWK